MKSIDVPTLNITVSFTPEDLERLRADGTAIPPFWSGHPIPPQVGDLLRFGLYQCAVTARVWEHDGAMPVLRLYVSDLQKRSDVSPH